MKTTVQHTMTKPAPGGYERNAAEVALPRPVRRLIVDGWSHPANAVQTISINPPRLRHN
jgi:hypothetical protein